MSGMTTVLTEFSNSGNSRTSTLNGHTALKPKIVIEKRRVAEAGQEVAEQSVKVVFGTVDAADLPLAQKVSFEVIARYPVKGDTSDVSGALTIIKDIVSGDEFANSVNTQEFL